MSLIVLEQREREQAEQYALWLRRLGLQVTRCGGDTGADCACGPARSAACHLWETAAAVVFDPWLDNWRGQANSAELVALLRTVHPETPVILAGPGPIVPTWVERLARSDPRTLAVFPATEQALGDALARLLQATPDAGPIPDEREQGAGQMSARPPTTSVGSRAS
jgi:hypothetical protein